MKEDDKKIAFFTNIAPHYRESLWLKFANELDEELHFFYGESSNQSITSIDFNKKEWKEFRQQLHKLQNIQFKKRLVFQRKAIGYLFSQKWDCVILLGDANLLSNWLLAILSKFKGIPVIFWGHGIYGNEGFLKRFIRKTFLSLSDLNLVYGHWAKEMMVNKNGFSDHKVKVIYNSLNYEASLRLRKKSLIQDYYKDIFKNNLPTLIFIGRLTRVKKLDLLINAVCELNSKKKSYNLMLIGDGEARQELENLGQNLDNHICFYGACYDEQKISHFIANADLCVSPGNVGLTSIHALSYGTPVCTNNDFINQMPEFEAIVEGKTGCFFDNKSNNLSETISDWFKNSMERDKIRENCYEIIDNYYNPTVQVKILKQALAEIL